jgi:hypothetical protein
VKDLDVTKQKSYGHLAGGGSKPRKVDVRRCSGVFRLRTGSPRLEESLKIALPGKHVFTPDGRHRVSVDFAGQCQGSVETFFRISRLIGAYYEGAAVGIRLDIRSGSVEIRPTQIGGCPFTRQRNY